MKPGRRAKAAAGPVAAAVTAVDARPVVVAVAEEDAVVVSRTIIAGKQDNHVNLAGSSF